MLRRLRSLSRQRLLARFMLVFFAVVIPLLLVEGVLRLRTEPAPTTRPRPGIKVKKSAALGWIFPADTSGTYRSSGRPTELVTNAWGLRGPAVPTDSLTQRVLILGDSYAFGWGVADSSGFARLIEAELRRRFPGAATAVVNGGIPGYAPYQQLRLLARVRQRVKIEAVVATISLANDMVDELRIRRYAPDHLDEFSYELRDPGSIAARLIGSSRLLTLLDERTNAVQFAALNARQKCVRLADESLTALAETCREAEIPLIWVVVPRKQEVRPTRTGSWLLNHATERVRSHVLGLATHLAVPVVDLKPALRAVQATRETYLPGDAHWNEAGHQAVAEAVLPTLLEAWTPQRSRH